MLVAVSSFPALERCRGKAGTRLGLAGTRLFLEYEYSEIQSVIWVYYVRIHSAPSLVVKLGSDVAARGEPPRFTPSWRKATMLHAASLDGAVC